MNDKRGLRLNIGDTVALTISSYKKNSTLKLGTVVGFDETCVLVKTQDNINIRKKGSSIAKCANE